MIIVFPFIVLKFFSFCCHFFHSVLCCNRLVYSCFILIVKSDSNFNRNSSCLLSILFNLFVIHLCLYLVFYLYNLTFLISDCILFFLYVFCLFCYLVLICLPFLLLCLFYYSVFPLILSLCHSVSFHVFVALPLLLFFSSFWLHFYSFTCLFFDIFA